MIERIEGLTPPAVGLRASGDVTREDYERVAIPAIHEAVAAHGRVRLLYVLGAGLGDFTLGAMWEDAKLGIGGIRDWERIAVVTDHDWVTHAVTAFGWMIPGDVRTFGDDLEGATAWIQEGLPPQG